MKPSINLLFLLLMLLPALVFAELPKQVELDFSVESGYVIMPINGEYLVDLDARNNLTVGDILTLVTPGSKVFHPVTKEILGSVDIPKGFLQVTRINSGYSYAKLFSTGVTPENGEQVRRFEQVPARFVDNLDNGNQLSRQIMTDLPQFKWLQDSDPQQPLLIFSLKADALTVKTADGNLLHSYSIKGDQQLVVKPSPLRQNLGAQPKPEPKLLGKVADTIMSAFSMNDNDFVTGESSLIRQRAAGQHGVWMGPNLSGHPVGLVVADFDGDGMRETAVALDNKLLITRINQGEYTEVQEITMPAGRQILSLDAVDLDQDGLPELYLTAVSGFDGASFVVKYTAEGQYAVVDEGIPWFLRVVDLPGQEQVLVGQEIGHDKQSFVGNPFHLRLENGSLVKGETFALPGLANIYSIMPFTDNDNKLNYVYLTDGDYLKVVSAAGVALWEASEYFGGSETCFANRLENDSEIVQPTCVRPRLIKTAGNEILVVQNDGQRLMQRYRKFKKSRIVSMGWNGFSMIENWRTADQNGYLGDFELADADNDGSAELVMAVKYQHAGLIDEARSAIVIYELD